MLPLSALGWGSIAARMIPEGFSDGNNSGIPGKSEVPPPAEGLAPNFPQIWWNSSFSCCSFQLFLLLIPAWSSSEIPISSHFFPKNSLFPSSQPQRGFPTLIPPLPHLESFPAEQKLPAGNGIFGNSLLVLDPLGCRGLGVR